MARRATTSLCQRQINSRIAFVVVISLGFTASSDIALPISFGPSSAPYVLAIQRQLLKFQHDSSHLDSRWSEVQADYSDLESAFIAASNEQIVPEPVVEKLVVAWLKKSTEKPNVQSFIADVLSRGLPVLGRKEESKVIGARAARKLLKAWKKLREEFTTIAEYRDSMLMLQFEYLPFVMQQTKSQNMSAAFDLAKAGRYNGHYFAYNEDRSKIVLAPSAIDKQPKDHLELLRYVSCLAVGKLRNLIWFQNTNVSTCGRYVGYYLCRETAPEPTVVTDFTMLLGWRYGPREEDTLLALHYPVFRKELESELQELTEEGTERTAKSSPNELLELQIALYKQFLQTHRSAYERFLENRSEHVQVGGSGRVSAEVSRDLSKIQHISTTAVDHRRHKEDIFEEGHQLKKSFSNFWKELAKDRAHLPAFKDEHIANHYYHIHQMLSERGQDRQTIDDIACVLRANTSKYSFKLKLSDPNDTKVKLAANFAIGFGDRGSGDVVFANPDLFNGARRYVPNTMDEKIKETLDGLYLGQNPQEALREL